MSQLRKDMETFEYTDTNNAKILSRISIYSYAGTRVTTV